MLADLQKAAGSNKSFTKLTLEQKILKTYADVVATAKEAGVTLPKS